MYPVDPGAAALITLSSGTSSSGKRPKVIARSHEFLIEQLECLRATIGAGEKQTVELTALPVFVLANLASRVTTLLPDASLKRPGSVDAERIILQMERFSPHRLLASPAFVERLADHCIERGITIGSVETVLTGGGLVLPRLVDKAARAFPAADLITVYGSSEAEPIAHVSAAATSTADVRRMRSGGGLLVGRPVSSVRVRILPLATRGDAPLESRLRDLSCGGAVFCGEVLVTGAHVVKGYLDGVGDSRTKVRVAGEVWHRTGDVGYFDEGGRLWLVGRVGVGPFSAPVEVAAGELFNVGRAAFVVCDGVRRLFVEAAEATVPLSAGEIAAKLAWAGLDEVRVVKRIPVDRRHNTKVVYDRLPAGRVKPALSRAV